MSGIVYILRSLKNYTYYIGSTNNLNRRLTEHHEGRSKYTKYILPIVLVFSQEYSTLKLARSKELWLKRLKDKGVLEQIISDGVIKKA
jgi:putative endonuclease